MKIPPASAVAVLCAATISLPRAPSAEPAPPSQIACDRPQTSWQESAEALFARGNLVAWCVVPFDARQRGPWERAAMLRELGFTKVAYDWREEHVPQFEEEMLAYQECGLELLAFWSWHPAVVPLFEKYHLRPQIWLINPSPLAETDARRVELAANELMPTVRAALDVGCPVGLYNHGGWGGEPQNLVAVCLHLRDHAGTDRIGIVYNLHHGHDHLHDFADSLAAMRPLLLCLNLNGMSLSGEPKILPLGRGTNDWKLLRMIAESGYRGPIGILGHREDVDAKVSLGENLQGLDSLLTQRDLPFAQQ